MPTLKWFRTDLRLGYNTAICHASKSADASPVRFSDGPTQFRKMRNGWQGRPYYRQDDAVGP